MIKNYKDLVLLFFMCDFLYCFKYVIFLRGLRIIILIFFKFLCIFFMCVIKLYIEKEYIEFLYFICFFNLYLFLLDLNLY